MEESVSKLNDNPDVAEVKDGGPWVPQNLKLEKPENSTLNQAKDLRSEELRGLSSQSVIPVPYSHVVVTMVSAVPRLQYESREGNLQPSDGRSQEDPKNMNCKMRETYFRNSSDLFELCPT